MHLPRFGVETGDIAMTYKLVVAAVGLCRHAVRIGGGFSWECSNGNELWNLVTVRDFFAKWELILFGLDRSCWTTICR